MPMNSRSALAVAAAVFALSGTAKADWQYTHWGMSPEAMARASAGKATVIPPDPRHVRAGLECLVTGTYQAGNQTFGLQGCFDKGRSLRMVALNIDNPAPSQGADIRGALISKYGKPTIVRSAGSLEWVRPGADGVIFYDLGGIGIDVIYQPNSGMAHGL